MSWALYVSHPEVVIDPNVPVGNWGLSEIGQQRAKAFAAKNKLPMAIPIFSSTEKKALDLAEILAQATASTITTDPNFGENDRSSTGFLPPEEFEKHVIELFGKPGESVAGWESALHAQARIVNAVKNALSSHDMAKPVVFTGHGCVGTLLKCHLAKRPVVQTEDQRETAHPGGGNVFAFDLARWNLLCDWTQMEDWQGF